MTQQRRCAQCWQAEAVVDGRLGGADRDVFERHAASCEVCTAEVLALARLHEEMRCLPVARSSPFEQRRAHVDLLRRANQEVLTAPRSRSRRWAPWLVASMVVLAGLVFGARRMRVPQVAWSEGGPPAFEVVQLGPAVWTQRVDGAVAEVSLTRGAAWFHVQRTDVRRRFLLKLPDGELEVHGTRFLAEVTAFRTERVEVAEGVVALRIAGSDERLLGAGESWRPPSVTAHASNTPAAGSSFGQVVDEPTPPRGPLVRPESPTGSALAPAASNVSPSRAAVESSPASASSSRNRRSRRAPSPVSSAPDPAQGDSIIPGAPSHPEPSAAARVGPTDTFAAGVDAFQRGELLLADQLLRRFVADVPSDPRVEDATFLRVLAHDRSGDKWGATRLAEEYLRRFPNGLRRGEADGIAHRP